MRRALERRLEAGRHFAGASLRAGPPGERRTSKAGPPYDYDYYDPDEGSRLYLGTDAGVFVSIDGGRRWMVEETGFGPAVTEWLALTRDAAGNKLLFAFTHGRGAWRVSLR